MAQSIRNIVSQINNSLEGIFKGGKFYGVAVSVEREGKSQPVVNELPVGFDDSYGLQMYHKIAGIAIKYVTGFGSKQNTINTFSMSAIVFNNEKQTKLKSDEIAMIMQSYFSNLQITSATILPTSIILNSPAIYAIEYRGTDFLLGEYTSLMQFNYTVEITFKSGCPDLCPEGFSQCKN